MRSKELAFTDAPAFPVSMLRIPSICILTF